ncbi:Cupin 2 conserved barrel domain protein [Enterobacter soli]|uniref:cupin domain-containing protein n=1 Tax=Enterobacter soli TaxID=885040 RepID=UPI000223CBB3|nr:cupin domain-containing protein [Enterobacter soli]AEN65188.1 Cupin 2 conserved barrel domain protein [Enterobacter soli]
MKKSSIFSVAARLPQLWQSRILGQVGDASIKVTRMGGEGIPPEVHDAFDEWLLVLDGELPLVVDNQLFTLSAGEYVVVPRGKTHHVPPGSVGTLLLVDINAPTA